MTKIGTNEDESEIYKQFDKCVDKLIEDNIYKYERIDKELLKKFNSIASIEIGGQKIEFGVILRALDFYDLISFLEERDFRLFSAKVYK